MDNIQIRFSGSGGQGLQLAAKILSAALILENKIIAHSQEYEPTSRGGLSRADVLVSSGLVSYPLATALDYVVILDEVAVSASLDLIKDSAIVIVDAERVEKPPVGEYRTIALPLIQTAREVGNIRAANVVSLGALAGCGKFCTPTSLEAAVRGAVRERFVDFNLDALSRGLALSQAAVAADPATLAVSN